MSRAAVLENADVVHHDRVNAVSLAFVDGQVAEHSETSAHRIDLRGHLVFPGLINAHDHLQLNNIPPIEHADSFANSYAWIDAMAAHRQRPDVSGATSVAKPVRHWHGGLKNLLGGATTVAHHDPWDDVFGDPFFPVNVVRDYGWSHSLQLGGAGEPGTVASYGPPVVESFLNAAIDRPWIIHLAEGA